MSLIFLETLKLSLNFNTDLSSHSREGFMLYLFYRTRRHFKNFERGIHYICQNDDKRQTGILPFSNFHLRIYIWVTSKQTQHMENWGLMIWTLSKFSEHAFFKEPDHPKYTKLNFDFVFFFIAYCSYYHKIRLASLKPHLPIHSNNFKFRVVTVIWCQLRF